MSRLFLLKSLLIGLLSVVFLVNLSFGDEADLYDFDVEEFEKKTWEWRGDFYGFTRLKLIDDSVALYDIRYPSGGSDSAFDVGGRLALESRWDFDTSRIILSGDIGLTLSSQDSVSVESILLREAYWELSLFAPHTLVFGKWLSRWGQGYAFNPVAMMEKTKNPEDPEASREGLWTISENWILGSGFIFDNSSISLIYLPVRPWLNDGYRSNLSAENILGARLYGLIGVTDINLYLTTRLDAGEFDLGVDFASNISSNFETHGELAVLNSAGSTSQQILAGIRYLTESEVTIIAELFSQSNGLTGDEIRQMYQSIRTLPQSSVSSYISLIQRSKTFAKNYGYLKVSTKEPFDILYLNPSIAWLFNLEDQSYSQSIQVTYAPFENWVIQMVWQHLQGSTNSQFGEGLVKDKLELAVNFSF